MTQIPKSINPRALTQLALATILTLFHVTSRAEALVVPVTFDQGFLQRLVETSLFTGENHSLSVWGDDSGCNDMTLSSPKVRIQDGQLTINSHAVAITGTPLVDSCLLPFTWEGEIATRQHVRVANNQGRIEFKTVDSSVFAADGSQTRAGKVWDLAKDFVHPHLDALTIDLSSSIKELQTLLPLFLATENVSQTQALINSFKLRELAVVENGLQAKLTFDLQVVETVDQADAGIARKLSVQELEAFVEIWQRWDTFLSFVIKTAARNTLKRESRDRLLEILVDARYELVSSLNHPEPRLVDPVRVMFVNVWQQLAPVLRDIATEISTDVDNNSAFYFLSFIAAADALQAIDSLGPVTGWDISIDGLRRLARLLINDANVDPLQSLPDVDNEMRDLFDFGPAPQIPEEFPAEPGAIESSFLSWLIQSAHANYANAGMVAKLNKMAPNKNNVHTYLPLVKELLHDTISGTLLAKPLDAQYHKLYRPLVLATAWQETCWRQFREKNKKLVPMKSSAGALGMMQIMPVVWKGFYDRTALANNISYNAIAGAEILRHYLVKYAIRKGEHEQKGGADNLAYASYAAYNGGPRHLSRYRLAKTSKSLQEIDSAFKDKFLQVRDGNELAVATCF